LLSVAVQGCVWVAVQIYLIDWLIDSWSANCGPCRRLACSWSMLLSAHPMSWTFVCILEMSFCALALLMHLWYYCVSTSFVCSLFLYHQVHKYSFFITKCRAATWSLKSPIKVPFLNSWSLMSLNLKKWSLKSLFLCNWLFFNLSWLNFAFIF